MLRLKLIQYRYGNQLHHLKINYTEQKEQSTWLSFAIFHPKTFAVDRNLLWMMRTNAMKLSLVICCMFVKRRLLFTRCQPTVCIRLLCLHFWHFCSSYYLYDVFMWILYCQFYWEDFWEMCFFHLFHQDMVAGSWFTFDPYLIIVTDATDGVSVNFFWPV